MFEIVCILCVKMLYIYHIFDERSWLYVLHLIVCIYVSNLCLNLEEIRNYVSYMP